MTEVVVLDDGSNIVNIAIPGPAGVAGEGVPTGGATGQLLAKLSNTDFDTHWITASGTGTVTSVNASVSGSGLSVSDGPITAAGTLAFTVGAALSAIGALTPANAKIPYYTGASSAALADLTAAGISMIGAANVAAQTALLDSFSGSIKGLVPASAGGTTNFLRADGTWAAPPGGGGGVSDGDKGDITVSASGATWTIDNSSVTLAKIANIATDRLLGRDTTASGVVEELTVGGGIEFTGSGGLQTSAFTGDVTKSAGGTATTIANNVVSLAKMATMATASFLGRNTAGTGNVEVLSAATAAALLNSSIAPVFANITSKPTTLAGYGITDAQGLDSDLTAIAALSPTKGNIMVGNGSAWVALGVGTNTHVLTADSAEATGVKWAAGGGGGGGGTPGGSDTQIQFNDGGAFGGDSALLWNKTSDYMTIAADAQGLLRLGASGDVLIGRGAAADLRLGAADASTAVAQTISVQNVVAGTSNTAGANLTINGSRGTGNAKGGKIILQTTPVGSSGTSQNTPSTTDYIEFLPAGATTGELDRARLRSNVDSSRILWEFHYSGYGIGTSSASLGVWSNNNCVVQIGASGIRIHNTGRYEFSSSSTFGNPDIALRRTSSTVIEINNCTNGTYRDLLVRHVRVNPTAVASLITASSAGEGALAWVNDATATTPRSTVAGGGSNKVLVMSDGTNWLIVA